MVETTIAIARTCKRILQDYYGPRLKGLILYGSLARSQASAGGDMDLLVLLDEKNWLRQAIMILRLHAPVMRLSTLQLPFCLAGG